MGLKVGVNLWTVYGWNLPEPVSPEVLRRIGAMGASGVELVVDQDANSAGALVERAAGLRAVLDSAGLEVPSVGTTLFHRNNLGARDPEARSRAIEIVRDGCRVARAYNARVFLVVAGTQEPGVEYARTYDAAAESLRQAGSYASDLGVTIGVENVFSGFLVSAGEFARFLSDVGHPAVKAYLDPGNGAAVGMSYPENWVTAVAGNIAMVHAKDYDRSARQHVPCGLGELDWGGIIAALRATGYDDFVTVETPPLGGRAQLTTESGLHAAETSVRWLKRLVHG